MKKATDFVDVYAKLPHGQTFLLPDGRHVTVAGCPVSQLVDGQGQSLGQSVTGGFGQTRVAAGDWEYIVKAYKDLPIMRSGLIFVAQDEASGKDQARDHAELLHGLEPLDPEKAATRPENPARADAFELP